MEHRTKFDLDQNVAQWKARLSKSQKMTSENIEELSDHLYSEIEELQELGLDEEEAFLVARKRIGSIDCIAAEFRKVNNKLLFAKELMPYIKGILILLAFSLLVDLVGKLFLIIGLKAGIAIHELNMTVFLVLLVFLTSFCYSLYHKFRNHKAIFPVKITTLTMVILITGVLHALSSNALFQIAKPTELGIALTTLQIFKVSFVLLLLAFSCIVAIYTKKKGLEIAD
ncbi:MAG: permease prefix domain 1-containing protein [Bacteroidota bacterium]